MIFNYYIHNIHKIRADYNYEDKKFCLSWLYRPEYNGKAKRYDWEILWDVRIINVTVQHVISLKKYVHPVSRKMNIVTKTIIAYI